MILPHEFAQSKLSFGNHYTFYLNPKKDYKVIFGNQLLEHDGKGNYEIKVWCSNTIRILRQKEIVFNRFFTVNLAPLSVDVFRSRESGDTLNYNDLDKAYFTTSLKNYDISVSPNILKVEGYYMKDNLPVPISIDTPNKYNGAFSIPATLAMDIRKSYSPILVLIFTGQFCEKPVKLAPIKYYLK